MCQDKSATRKFFAVRYLCPSFPDPSSHSTTLRILSRSYFSRAQNPASDRNRSGRPETVSVGRPGNCRVGASTRHEMICSDPETPSTRRRVGKKHRKHQASSSCGWRPSTLPFTKYDYSHLVSSAIVTIFFLGYFRYDFRSTPIFLVISGFFPQDFRADSIFFP